jgi:hypothetical protein
LRDANSIRHLTLTLSPFEAEREQNEVDGCLMKVEGCIESARRLCHGHLTINSQLSTAVQCQAAMLGWNNSKTPMVFCTTHRKTTKGGSLPGNTQLRMGDHERQLVATKERIDHKDGSEAAKRREACRTLKTGE